MFTSAVVWRTQSSEVLDTHRVQSQHQAAAEPALLWQAEEEVGGACSGGSTPTPACWLDNWGSTQRQPGCRRGTWSVARALAEVAASSVAWMR